MNKGMNEVQYDDDLTIIIKNYNISDLINFRQSMTNVLQI